MMMCIQNLVLFCRFLLKILSKNQILTSIKGRYTVANLQKTKIYNTNLDLVTDNVYTNFGLILSIPSHSATEDKDIFSSCDATLQKMPFYNPNVDLVNDNVYTKFCLDNFIPSPDIEQKLNSEVNQGP